MAKTVKIDVVDKSIADENNRNIPIINQENPCYGYAATAKEVAQLIQLSSYYVYAAGTLNIIDGYSFYKYFPEEAGSSGGGGGSGDITRTEIQEMIDASLPDIDSAMSTTSKNPVQNNTITEFVNSSIASNTANYVGQFASVDELNAYSGTLTNNDYAFVIGTDDAGNTKYDRYKWNMKEWLFEYTLNNSSFTAEQWASIQSGIKASDVEQITTNKNDITLIKTNKLDASNAVGRNVTGTKYNIDGTDYTAQTGAEIFNNYSNINNINKAVGKYSHAEGYLTVAKGDNSHAEGASSHAFGDQSHAEGEMTTASGLASHAEGWNTTASGAESHSEGWRTTASNNDAHAEGQSTVASGLQSHAEGTGSIASGECSHAEGYNTTTSGNYSHAEGYYAEASSDYQHAQGKYNVKDTEGKYAFIIGNGNSNSRSNAFAVDWNGLIYVNNATEGVDVSTFSGVGKDVNGTKSTINGTEYTSKTGAEIFNDYTNNKAIGAYSHAEGLSTRAIGDLSHAEGQNTETSATSAHSEGMQTKATGMGSHAEGAGTTASGNYSHSEGSGTQATGDNSHAEGTGSIASGKQSHAEGTGTKASSENQHVQGKYNTEDTEGKYAFIIGNGEYDSTRSNAFAIDWDGKIYVNNATDGVDISTFKSGIGKDVTGIDFTVGDTTYTAGSNAEIFNDYDNNKAIGANSHAEGTHTVALSENQHVQGRYNKPSDEYAFIIGNGTEETLSNAFAIDWNGLVYPFNSEEGVDIADVGSKAHSHDNKDVIDLLSDSDGKLWYNGTAVDTGVGKDVTGTEYTISGKDYTSKTGAEIFNDYTNNKAIGAYSHAEGRITTTSGICSHAECERTTASGNYSHAECESTTASGNSSHAEGNHTNAIGYASHSEGGNTKAIGKYSHAEGDNTKASSDNQHVQGKFNIEDTEGKYAFIIGNGDGSKKSNAFAVDWNGLIYVNNTTEGVDVSKLSSGGSSSITLDDSISETSENAVKNKVISAELDTIRQSIPLSVSKLTNDSNYQTKENLDDALASYAKTTDIPTVPSNVSSFTNDKQYQTKTDIDTTLSTYAKTADLKTKLSEFENDEEYIKNTVDNLINYYKKIELYTKNEVDTLIGNINKLTSEIVTELPTSDISTSTIYLIKKTDSNAYTQYMYINSTWAELGDTTVDLSNYYSKSDIDDKLSSYATSDTVTTHTSDSTIHVTSDEKTSWNNATTKAHEHDNKTVIDKFSELDGTVLYDGKQIASGTVWNGTKAEYDAIAVKDAETTYVVTDEDDSISGALIDDSSTSTSKTWSAKKISKMISDVIKTHETISDEYTLQPNSMGKVPINFNLPDNAVVIGIIKADVVYGGDENISINVLSPDSVQLYNPTSTAVTYKVKMMVSYMLT